MLPHVNWFDVTYTGQIFWEEWAKELDFGDDDYIADRARHPTPSSAPSRDRRCWTMCLADHIDQTARRKLIAGRFAEAVVEFDHELLVAL